VIERQEPAKLEFRQAIANAIADEMEQDDKVMLLGEDVAAAGGVFQATRGLLQRFGARRVIDTPISELALAGAAFGAAITGMRPIIEIMFGDFMFLAMDSLANQSAKYWFLSNEQRSVPLVVRSAVGAAGGFGAIHSQIPVPWLLSIPGIKIFAPSNSSDAYWLLRDAIRDPNPVVFLEHKGLYGSTSDFENSSRVEGAHRASSSTRVVRRGSDVTLVGSMASVPECLLAADELALHGIEAEVLDLCKIRPLDSSGIIESVLKTGALVTVEEGPATGGWSAEVIASAVECRLSLRAVVRVGGPEEQRWLPWKQAITEAALKGAVNHNEGGLSS
jgi:pyruvate/2-oxoglutarate/acetoin dehydrogenase E1 component